MTIEHLNTLLQQLRSAEALGAMPAKVMRDIQRAIERTERRISQMAA